MNKKIHTLLFLFLCPMILFGCATWQYIPRDNARWKSGSMEAILPKGWVKYNSVTHSLFLTQDGILLQRITVAGRPLNKELSLSKKKLKEDMLLQDISGVITDELSLNQEYKNFKLLENKPATIGNVQVFRLVYTYNNEDFMKYKSVTYGFIVNKKYYEIEYLAAQQHYFEKGLKDFETFIDTMIIRNKSA